MQPTPVTPPPEVPGYRLGECLGRGASGTVWAALRSSDLLPVAVKVVPVGPDSATADQAARELAVLSRVPAEGLVGFHEAIGLGTEPPCVALVLEHVAGGSLWGAVRARGHLSVGESVTVLVPVARAMARLHAMGVVHGDVSPRNVLLQRTGQPVLSDLGVARVAGVSDAGSYGTTGFIAPEVESGGRATAASDVYAVGALGWWCVTGEVPDPSARQRPLESLAGLPQAWRELTFQALDPDPSARPTAAELALGYFDSAPCEPLRLVVGADDTSLLTHRLRKAPVDPAVSSPRATGRHGRSPRQPAGQSERQPARRSGRRRGRRPVSGRGRRPRHRWQTPPRWVVAGAATVTALGLAVAGVAFADRFPWHGASGGGPSGGAEKRPAASPNGPVASGEMPSRPATPTAGPSRVAATSRVADPVMDRSAARRDPRGLMQALADLRARALTSRAATDLQALDLPGSAAMLKDTTLLGDLTAHKRSYRDVALHVRTASCVDCTTSVALIDAAVDTMAYTVVDATGVARHERLPPAPVLRFSLRWQDDRWRIEQVSTV